jgi:prepilin-type N-terminal cleavage/methylation domain-containing protein
VYKRQTLPEVMTTVAILGILLAIAGAIWLSVIEARRVDAAANQLASDMRLAHTRATNQLTDWRVVLAPERTDEDEGPDYYLMRLDGVYETGNPDPGTTRIIPRTFEGNVKIRDHSSTLHDNQSAGWWLNPDVADTPVPSRTLEFNSDGSMLAYSGPSGTVYITVDGDPEREITFLAATSRIGID